MIILSQINDVFIDFDLAWSSFASQSLLGPHAKPLLKQRNAYDLSKRYGLDRNLVDDLLKSFHKQSFSDKHLYKDALQLIRKLPTSHKVILVTGGYSEADYDESLVHPLSEGISLELVNSDDIKQSFNRHKPDVFISGQLHHLEIAKQYGIQHRIWIERGQAQKQSELIILWKSIATNMINSCGDLENIIHKLSK
jgi:hypothetical protein